MGGIGCPECGLGLPWTQTEPGGEWSSAFLLKAWNSACRRVWVGSQPGRPWSTSPPARMSGLAKRLEAFTGGITVTVWIWKPQCMINRYMGVDLLKQVHTEYGATMHLWTTLNDFFLLNNHIHFFIYFYGTCPPDQCPDLFLSIP